MACSSTSASEWPSRPRSNGISTPPMTSLRPAPARARPSPRLPMRMSGIVIVGTLPRLWHRPHGLRSRKSSGIGDLEILCTAWHQQGDRPSASMALASSVTRSPAGQRLAQEANAKHLGRLRQPFVRCGPWRPPARPPSLQRVGNRMRQQPTHGIRWHASISLVDQLRGVIRQRAASCTSTQSWSARTLRQQRHATRCARLRPRGSHRMQHSARGPTGSVPTGSCRQAPHQHQVPMPGAAPAQMQPACAAPAVGRPPPGIAWVGPPARPAAGTGNQRPKPLRRALPRGSSNRRGGNVRARVMGGGPF
jgi:hypothetical protein